MLQFHTNSISFLQLHSPGFSISLLFPRLSRLFAPHGASVYWSREHCLPPEPKVYKTSPDSGAPELHFGNNDVQNGPIQQDSVLEPSLGL